MDKQMEDDLNLLHAHVMSLIEDLESDQDAYQRSQGKALRRAMSWFLSQRQQPLMNLNRMARRLGVTQKWLKMQVEGNKIPGIKAGNRYLFNPRAVEDALLGIADYKLIVIDEK